MVAFTASTISVCRGNSGKSLLIPIFLLCTMNRISGVMVSVLTSRVVGRGFISGVMVSMLTSRVVDHGFEPRLSKTKDC